MLRLLAAATVAAVAFTGDGAGLAGAGESHETPLTFDSKEDSTGARGRPASPVASSDSAITSAPRLLVAPEESKASGGDKPSAFVPDEKYAFVPVSLAFDPVNIRQSRVRMCKLEFAKYHAGPSVSPMVEDLIVGANCRDRPPPPGVAFDMTLDELEQDYVKRGCDVASEAGELEPSCAISGLISHESRCGSTLISNMMASLPETLIYSELGPPNSILRQPGLTFPERVHWLRVMYAGMARPIALHGYKRRQRELSGQPATIAPVVTAETAAVSGTALTDEQFIAQGAADWSPKYLYLKTQHTTSLYLDVYQAAFPRMPWIYLHRCV
jgi:hypothetical protein